MENKKSMRVEDHPILGKLKSRKQIWIEVDSQIVPAFEGEPIAAALLARGIRICRETPKRAEPRGIFCAIGQCTDCMMIVDDVPNVRTCIMPARNGMKLKTQRGLEKWSRDHG